REVRPEYERNSPRMSSNSYVNLKIATCLVRYADDRLIDQRFLSVPIVFVRALPALRISLRRRTCRARNGIGERLPLSAFQLHARSRRPEWPAKFRKDATTRVGATSRPPC
ncbi:hypothetical protein, partial [Burkholderia multivorans]|uniref:hypothetical protein n=1 Tax=Burkholderia multivorans TaxID=87883 RepID=UPI001C279C9D